MPSKSSRRWLKEHFSDTYVKQAKEAGYRSRAIYKLKEIEERYHLFKPGMIVIDLGAAPGGWSQFIIERVKPTGRVIAVDLLPMESIKDVDFIEGDFSDEKTQMTLQSILNHAKVDWVVSDMAPNVSGNESIDVPRSLYLAELTLEFALSNLGPQGGLLIKVFQGTGFDDFFKLLKAHFKKVMVLKPKASRGRSRELYVLAKQSKAGK